MNELFALLHKAPTLVGACNSGLLFWCFALCPYWGHLTIGYLAMLRPNLLSQTSYTRKTLYAIGLIKR